MFQIGLADVLYAKNNENNSLKQTINTQQKASGDSTKVNKTPINNITPSKSKDTNVKESTVNSKKITKNVTKPNSKTIQLIEIQDSINTINQNISNSDSDTIIKLKKENNDLKSQIEKLKINLGNTFPNYVIFILSGLVLGLLIFTLIVNRMKNKKISFISNRKEHYKTLYKDTEEEKVSLSNLKTNLSSEIFQLKKEKENLQSEIRVLQQNSRNKEETKIQDKIQIPHSLYADSIINGQFNCVKEQPNEDTIFELKLDQQNNSRATIIIYPEAFRRVIANPAFLEGCEKQILGNNSVTMIIEGIAQKDSSGKWNITKSPIVKII